MGFGSWLKARVTPSKKGWYLGKVGDKLGVVGDVGNKLIGGQLQKIGAVPADNPWEQGGTAYPGSAPNASLTGNPYVQIGYGQQQDKTMQLALVGLAAVVVLALLLRRK